MSVPQQLDADRIISGNVRCPDGSKWNSTKCWNYLSKMQNATLRRFFFIQGITLLFWSADHNLHSELFVNWGVNYDRRPSLEASIYYSSPNRHAALCMPLCSCLGRKMCLNSSYFFSMPCQQKYRAFHFCRENVYRFFLWIWPIVLLWRKTYIGCFVQVQQTTTPTRPNICIILWTIGIQ